MDKVRPPKLKEGDEIRIIAPASAPDMGNLSKGIARLKKLGFKISLGSNIKRLVQVHELAATAVERSQEILNAFRDDNVKAIFCARGGYGSIHSLPLLDFDVIHDHPKIFIGYSDITALHLAFNKLSNLVTFHGPMPGSDPEEMGKPYFKTIIEVLEGKTNNFATGDRDLLFKYINPGTVEGTSIGTNISVASSLIGTKYMPDTTDKILFAEDTGITAGDIDRYLFTMKLANLLGNFSGFAFGDIKTVNEQSEPMPFVEDVIEDYMEELKKPSLYGLPFGHGEGQMLIPLNSRIKLSTSTEPTLEFREPVVE